MNNPNKPSKLTFYRRRAIALGAVAVLGLGIASVGEGDQQIDAINHVEKTLKGHEGDAQEYIQTSAFKDQFDAGEITTVTVQEPKTAFATAQDFARDDIDVRDMAKLVEIEAGVHPFPGEKLALPTDLVDPRAALPQDNSTHVR
jgi:hypothetical protein